MANLIVTVIAIALVAVASLMGAYYGGSAFLKGSAKAAASALVNQGQQIAAGWVLFANDNGGTAPTSVEVLVTGNYITENPVAPSSADALNWVLYDLEGPYAATTNEELGDIPAFAAVTFAKVEICKEVNVAAGVADGVAWSTTGSGLFGDSRFICATGGTNGYVMAYKIQ